MQYLQRSNIHQVIQTLQMQNLRYFSGPCANTAEKEIIWEYIYRACK